MNPLLVAILLRQSAARGELADAGAGRVFFVSTLGSVAGVIVTAFGLIQYMSNFAATLVVAAVLAALPLVLLFGSSIRLAQRKELDRHRRTRARRGGRVAGGRERLHGALVAGQLWRHRMARGRRVSLVVRHRQGAEKRAARQRTVYAHVFSRRPRAEHGRRRQPLAVDVYVRARSAVVRLPAGHAQRAGARHRGRHGADAPRRAAESTSPRSISTPPRCAPPPKFSDSMRGKVHARQADARTYLRSCESGYDVVIVDLFHGDGVPDYLVTREFFRDLKRCLGTRRHRGVQYLCRPRSPARLRALPDHAQKRAAVHHAVPSRLRHRQAHQQFHRGGRRAAALAGSATISATCRCGIFQTLTAMLRNSDSARPTAARARTRNYRCRQSGRDGPRRQPADQPPLRDRSAAGGVFRELDVRRRTTEVKRRPWQADSRFPPRSTAISAAPALPPACDAGNPCRFSDSDCFPHSSAPTPRRATAGG